MLVAQITNLSLAPCVPARKCVVSTPIIMSLLPSVPLTTQTKISLEVKSNLVM